MKAPHLLRVSQPAAAFAELVAAARALGLRLGWLNLAELAPPPELAAAAGTGMLRAVALGAAGVVVAKPLAGPAVLRDVLREHFLGCAAVLVAGEGPLAEDPALGTAPRLRAEAGGFVLAPPAAEAGRCRTAAELAARLRKPRL